MVHAVPKSQNDTKYLDDNSVATVIKKISEIPEKKNLAQEVRVLYDQLSSGIAVDKKTINPLIRRVGVTLSDLEDVETIVGFRKTIFGLSERITMQNP